MSERDEGMLAPARPVHGPGGETLTAWTVDICDDRGRRESVSPGDRFWVTMPTWFECKVTFVGGSAEALWSGKAWRWTLWEGSRVQLLGARRLEIAAHAEVLDGKNGGDEDE